ncbi:hypothetical protein [Mesorhizobium sangaii]|uniref:Uncharacterized protein n=1 Tax=Mesorhizobium sangaii TaxID=505389 RepID=A0A841P9M9_9HYPH|nr:hypothetical protein [Mesorhizobium sangaii]MBB6407650.1 hypothetical protein [Mesorhizobium sangaii]
MYLTRDMSSMGRMQRPAAPKAASSSQPVKLTAPLKPVNLTSVRPQLKPVRVVRLYDPKKKADDLYWIRKLERAGLTEGNSKAVKLMKDNFRKRYGERV